MIRTKLALALLGASAFMALGTAQASAQGAEPDAIVSDAPAPDEAAANNEFLQAQVESLQAQIDGLKKQMTAAQPSWKGAPQWSDPDNGWTFKPKGVIQFDAGYVSLPGSSHIAGGTVGGVNTNNLGWNMRARRLIFGAEGSIPGGFGYKMEFELSQGTVNYEDLILTYQKPGSPLLFTIGHHYPLQSLEQLTSNRFTSFMERSSNVDAFGYGRRLGLSAAYLDPAGQFTLTAGVWGQDIADNNIPTSTVNACTTVTSGTTCTTTPVNNPGSNPSLTANFRRTGWQASVRGTYSPMIGAMQGHLGFQFQHRIAQRDAQNVRYRVRPFTQTTDQRFIDTGTIAADGDDILGVELAGIWKSLHVAGEAQKVWVRGYNAAKVFTNANDSVGGGKIFAEDPTFFSWYAEAGYFLTGETRGYKGGKWDRTKVLNPVEKGGIGAIQINARVDQTDLSDKVGSGPIVAGTNFVNGGKQTGYQASLIWLPTDYVKFLAQYTRAHVEGGSAATGTFVSSTVPAIQDRSYNVDQFGLRAQLDF
jgi:phosphate-selective porin OprO/OprP